MVAHLIGPTKWVKLAEALKVYPGNFKSKISRLQSKYSKVSQIIGTCLTDWRIAAGPSADVYNIVDALRAVEVYWLAGEHAYLILSDNPAFNESFNYERFIGC